MHIETSSLMTKPHIILPFHHVAHVTDRDFLLCMGIDSVLATQVYPIDVFQEEQPIVETFHNISDWRKRNWGNVDITMDNLMELRRQLMNHNVSAACDGSVVEKHAAHAWSLFETKSGKIIIQGSAPVN